MSYRVDREKQTQLKTVLSSLPRTVMRDALRTQTSPDALIWLPVQTTSYYSAATRRNTGLAPHPSVTGGLSVCIVYTGS